MDIRSPLLANYERLLEQYYANVEGVLALQSTLIRDILPSVADELQLNPEATDWARAWLSDTSSLFRIARRNNFTRSLIMESIRRNLSWRLNNLWPAAPPPPLLIMHCLPAVYRDPCGRPILIFEARVPKEQYGSLKPLMIQVAEQLRVHLHKLNAGTDTGIVQPTLQYMVLLDLKDMSIQSLNVDLITWTLREVIPRFPGMLAGVIMVNYTWAHSGMWNIIKHVLPASALSRVFFLSQEELLNYFTPAALPRDYGGTLPFVTELSDPLQPNQLPLVSPLLAAAPCPVTSLHVPLATTFTSIAPTSLRNPYFGYPVASSAGISFRHGRRRKRDLARTLAWLWWMRWGSRLTFGLCVSILALIVTTLKRRDLFRFSKLTHWKGFLTSTFRP